MTEEDKNPEEKPSFFDFSDEEAGSWPPADSVPLEEESSSSEAEASPPPNEASTEAEDFDVEDLFSDDFVEETKAPEPAAPVEDLLPEFEPIQKSEPDLPEATTEPDLPEATTEPEPVIEEEEISLDELIAEEQSQADSETLIEEDDEGLISVTQPLAEAIDDKFEKESVDALYNDYSSSDPEPVTNIIDEAQETLPFRTFTTYDYSEEGLNEADLNEEEEKPGLNRNALVVIAVFLLVGGWYGFQAMFSRDYNSKRGRDRKSRRGKSKKIALHEKELIPIWELSNQSFTSSSEESILIKDMYYEAGRQNPFMLPDSVLADMVKAAELEMIKNQKPNTYRRKAYRATLIGVLTSTENTIALVNYQEAVFDVLEDTNKEKILKLATKAMDKTKENTQEMIVGSYIGPWQITKIDAPEDPFIEPRITIEHNYQSKILSMGKAAELGIFDEEGNFDNLEKPIDELALDDFKW